MSNMIAKCFNIYIVYIVQARKYKMAFKYYQSINYKLYQPTFNYFKFYTIRYLIYYI